MPRRPPFTQDDIRSRKQQTPPKSDFNDALDILGVRSTERDQRKNELNLICKLCKHVQLSEHQETPSRKAEAFQKADRWRKRQTKAWLDSRKIGATHPIGDLSFVLAVLDKEAELKKLDRLPQSLEQEAARLQAKGLSPEASFSALRDSYKRKSRTGRHESTALKHTVHRLQAFACEIDPALAWTDRRRIPPKLIPFITSVLEEAKIRYPSFINNPAKFRRLMQRPARSATCKAHHLSGVDVTPAETEREDRLAKMFL
jgi:hypothetical protein